MTTIARNTAGQTLDQMIASAAVTQLLSALEHPSGSPAAQRRVRIGVTSELRRRAAVRAAAATDAELIAELLSHEFVSEEDLLTNMTGVAYQGELERRHPAAVELCLDWEVAHEDVELTWFEGVRMLIEAVQGQLS